MRFGLLVILTGVLFLLKDMGYILAWQWIVIWPIIVILIGISIVARSFQRCRWCGSERTCSHKLRGWVDFDDVSCECCRGRSKK